MKPDRFVELWETKYEKLSPAHTDLMIERLLGFNIRSIDEEWIVKAIDVDGLKLLIDIVYQALEYQDEALKASSRRMVPQPDS